MAKTYIIYKDVSGLRWRDASVNIPGGYLPKEVKTAEKMRKFFGEGQQFERVDLEFRTASGQPVKHYTIKRGNDHALVDYENKLSLELRPEIVQYLKNYVEDTIIEDADRIIHWDDKIEFLKSHASQETLKEVEEFITSKQSDEGIKALCEEHAKKYYPDHKIAVDFID